MQEAISRRRSLAPCVLLLAAACESAGASPTPSPTPSPTQGDLQPAQPGGDASAASSDAGARDAGTDGSAPPHIKDPVTPGDPGASDVRCDVAADADARPISPQIYGINNELGDAELQRWGALRAGGNRLTAYNWENNASNAGSDWYFQNDATMSSSDAPATPLLELIDRAEALAASAVITLSCVDYVAADKRGDGDVRASGAGYLDARFKRNHAQKPSAFAATPNTQDGDVYQDELVAYLKAQRGAARVLFSLDNEPDLWSFTHAEVYPSPVTYADLWKRNHDTAKAAKAVWPSAEVLGFVSYGWNGFVSLQNAPDAGGRSFVEWYLDQAKAAEESEGRRLIDYLDVHWYPEARGGGQRVVGGDNSDAVVAARVQAPRSLWDASYQEDSWIRDSLGGPIALLQWLQTRVDAHYPGTKLSFSEWNYGGGNHISGALAVADVLGVFGRHGVGLATYWPLSADEAFAHAAFRMYRNFDGAGGAFGDVSVAATSSDPASVAVYASIASAQPERTVIVLINRATSAKRVGVTVRHAATYTRAAVWTLAGGSATPQAGTKLDATASNAFSYALPGLSMAVLVPQP